ncbi:single-stranded DNA-binding protein [Clostridium sp.]|uniref:single-stranded DNA-binding protein n=1 Tax=Clostridium sp. TaxID=1506 RepID=UPI0039917620
MNKVILIGRLTKDPDLRFAAGSGTAVTRFTVAVNRRKKDDGADFINCIAFGKTGETIAQYLTKGRQIAINGNLRTGSYDAKDGTKRYTTDVIVENFDFISSDKSSNNQNVLQGNTDSFNDIDNSYDDMMPVDDGGEIPF